MSLTANAAVAHAVAPDDQAVALQANAAHTGAVSGAGVAPPLVKAWSVDAPGANASYPLIVNGVVYVTRTGNGSWLEARSQATGELLWSKPASASLQGPAYDRGRVFVVDQSGRLSAYEADTGALAWTVELAPEYFVTSAVTAVGGRVYVRGDYALYAVRERDGSVAWRAAAGGAGSAPAVTADGVYVSSSCHIHIATTLAGARRWVFSTYCSGGGGTSPVVANGRVWARDFAGIQPPILLDPATGTQIGTFASRSTPAVTPTASYLVDGTSLTAMGPSGGGPADWTFTSSKPLTTPPLAVDGRVFVGNEDGRVSAIEAGASVWSAEVGTGFIANVDMLFQTGLAAANGTLVVPAGSTLTAFRPAATVGQTPVGMTAPSVAGAGRAAERLVADVGVWSGLPTTYTYQWQRCDAVGANCTNIVSATGPVHTPGQADVGNRFRVTVTASSTTGSAQASGLSAIVGAALDPPGYTSLPEVTGTLSVYELLTATTGSWSGSPDGYTYQWFECDEDGCADIPGATETTFRPQGDRAGRYIGVDVTATNDAGPTTTSSLAELIRDYPPSAYQDPAITGIPRVGQTLRVSTGAWTGSPTSYSYAWGRCDANGNNCTEARAEGPSPEYTLVSDDVGRYLVALVFAVNSGGEGEAADDIIGPVLAALPVSPSQPVAPPTRTPFRAPPTSVASAPALQTKLDLDTSQMPKRLGLRSVCPVDKRGRPRAGAFNGTYELSASAASTQVKLSAEIQAAKGKSKTTLPLAAGTTKRVDPFSEDIEIRIDRKRCTLLRRAVARSGKATLVLSLSLSPVNAGVAAESRTLRIPLRR